LHAPPPLVVGEGATHGVATAECSNCTYAWCSC